MEVRNKIALEAADRRLRHAIGESFPTINATLSSALGVASLCTSGTTQAVLGTASALCAGLALKSVNEDAWFWKPAVSNWLETKEKIRESEIMNDGVGHALAKCFPTVKTALATTFAGAASCTSGTTQVVLAAASALCTGLAAKSVYDDAVLWVPVVSTWLQAKKNAKASIDVTVPAPSTSANRSFE